MKHQRHWYEGLRCERCNQKIVPANSGIYQSGIDEVDGKQVFVAKAWHWPEDCPARPVIEEVK